MKETHRHGLHLISLKIVNGGFSKPERTNELKSVGNALLLTLNAIAIRKQIS